MTGRPTQVRVITTLQIGVPVSFHARPEMPSG